MIDRPLLVHCPGLFARNECRQDIELFIEKDEIGISTKRQRSFLLFQMNNYKKSSTPSIRIDQSTYLKPDEVSLLRSIRQ